jgi:hypothetical protein
MHIQFDILNVLIVSDNFKLLVNDFTFITCGPIAAIHDISHTFFFGMMHKLVD